MHADRTNRTMLIVFAVLLLAVGGLGFAASYDLFGTGSRHRAMLNNPLARFFGQHGLWLWPVIAVAGAIIAVLAVRWLVALLFSTDRAGDLAVEGGGGRGTTTLAPSALAGAVQGELEELPGVAAAKARVIGSEDDPELVVTVQLQQDADLVAARRRIVAGPVEHARHALGRPDLPVQVNLSVSAARSGRVA